MPTAEREGLREALARYFWAHSSEPITFAGEWDRVVAEEKVSPHGKVGRGVKAFRHKADALIAGPLADFLTQADTAAQAVVEQAPQAARIKFLETEVSEALDRHESVLSQKHWFEEKLSDVLAEVARLSAEVEARDKALKRIAGMKEMGLVANERPDGTATYKMGQKPTSAALIARAALAAGQDKEGGKP